jgi:CRP/FNR family transcriptional regulator, cyclic AMP receptor protein
MGELSNPSGRGGEVIMTAQLPRARTDAVAALAGVGIFSRLGPAVLERLAASAIPRSYPRGALIFSEGDPGNSLLVLTSGAVTIFRSSAAGERMVLNVMRPPEIMGELALLDRAPRSASAEAMQPTTALAVSRDTFLAVLHQQPAVLDPLLQHLGSMIRRLSDQTADHVFLDLAGRLAKALLREADSLPSRSEHPVIELTQTRLAEMAGGSRQSVNQVLGGFADRGLLRIEGRRIVLTNMPALRRRAGLSGSPPPARSTR